MVTRTRIRRWAATRLRKAHLHLLAARVDPGPRVRLWDSDWNLRLDSDRGERVDLTTAQAGDAVVFEPSTTIRWSGRRA